MYEFLCYMRKYTNLRVLKDVDNLIETTTILTTMFCGVITKSPTIDQNTPTAIQRREIASALCQDIRHVLPSLRIPFEKNAVAFLKTFSLLHTLVSRDGHDTRRESIHRHDDPLQLHQPTQELHQLLLNIYLLRREVEPQIQIREIGHAHEDFPEKR